MILLFESASIWSGITSADYRREALPPSTLSKLSRCLSIKTSFKMNQARKHESSLVSGRQIAPKKAFPATVLRRRDLISETAGGSIDLQIALLRKFFQHFSLNAKAEHESQLPRIHIRFCLASRAHPIAPAHPTHIYAIEIHNSDPQLKKTSLRPSFQRQRQRAFPSRN